MLAYGLLDGKRRRVCFWSIYTTVLAYECVLTYGLLDGLLIPEELHGHHRLHVLVQLIHERNS